MNTSNLLGVSVNFIDFAMDKIGATNLNWLGKIVQAIIGSVGIIGLGVILFTIILKTIVLPLDIYSRVKSKKQSLMMEKMRPQMEKLQKQYANDKQMYNQKVMELQKKNGYSMFGACIPMIVSLVIFIIVFQAFSTYSQYANLGTYNGMVDSYNASVQTYVYEDVSGRLNKPEVSEGGFLIACDDETQLSLNGSAVTYPVVYKVNFDKFKTHYEKYYNETLTAEDRADSEANPALPEDFDSFNENEKIAFVRNYVRKNAREEAANYYRSNKTSFLHIKNLWYPDSMLNKELPKFKDFNSAISRAVGSTISASYEESYNEVTYNLYPEKHTYNGYFVLIVLAIGFMFLQQFITMRSQKASAELSSVDGSAARTNKWMMVLMPIIFGVFSFFYSAAFSLYMITNTVYSLITTLIINKILVVRFDKKEEKEELDKYSKREPKNRKRLK